MYKLSSNSRKHIIGVEYGISVLIARVLKKSPHDFGIPSDGGVRTAKEQAELYAKGRTEPGAIITSLDGYTKKSYHQSGSAFDIYVYDEHGACWNCLQKYADIANVVKSEFSEMMKEGGYFSKTAVLRWGGDWSNPDRPHFEIRY